MTSSLREIMDEALLEAAEEGDADQVKELLSKGARMDVRHFKGQTPLLVAAQEGHTEVCEVLLSEGAQVDVKDDAGDTPLLVGSSLLWPDRGVRAPLGQGQG